MRDLMEMSAVYNVSVFYSQVVRFCFNSIALCYAGSVCGMAYNKKTKRDNAQNN